MRFRFFASLRLIAVALLASVGFLGIRGNASAQTVTGVHAFDYDPCYVTDINVVVDFGAAAGLTLDVTLYLREDSPQINDVSYPAGNAQAVLSEGSGSFDTTIVANRFPEYSGVSYKIFVRFLDGAGNQVGNSFEQQLDICTDIGLPTLPVFPTISPPPTNGVTPEPTGPVNGTPIVQPTVPSVNDGGNDESGDGGSSGGTSARSLPKTGAGQTSSTSSVSLLVGAMVVVCVAGAMTLKRRVR